MKVSKEWEASDIDDKNNKTHQVLMISLVFNAITWPKASPEMSDDDVLKQIHGQVAAFLNMIERSGFTVSPKEEIPQAFGVAFSD